MSAPASRALPLILKSQYLAPLRRVVLSRTLSIENDRNTALRGSPPSTQSPIDTHYTNSQYLRDSRQSLISTPSILTSFARPLLRQPSVLSFSSPFSRSFSTTSFPLSRSRTTTVPLPQRRNIFFRSSAPKEWKASTTVFHRDLALLQEAAKLDPTNTEKQVAFLQGLVKFGKLPGAHEVISIWERWAEFDPSSPVLHSDEAFQAYCKALDLTGQSVSILPAVNRREVILATYPPTQPAITPKSNSQRIADDVLSDSAGPLTPPTGVSGRLAGASFWRSLFSKDSAERPGSSAATAIHVVTHPSLWAVLVTALGKIAMSVFILVAVIGGTMGVLDYYKAPGAGSGGAVSGMVGKKHQPASKPAVKFADVIGVDEAKYELQDYVDFLKNPSDYTRLGATLPKGVLLSGPSGTGKTLLARAVAGEAGVAFFSVSGSEFEEMYVGVGARRVRDLFAAAREKGRAIVFIDELDAVGSTRRAADTNSSRMTINQLLTELDGFTEHTGVIVMAATNIPESLDPALTRPGRFDKKITVGLPDIRGRTELFKSYLSKVKYNKNINPTTLARLTSGFSPAQIKTLINEAAAHASKTAAHEVEGRHLEWALDKMILGPEYLHKRMSDDEKLQTSYHEIGHALGSIFNGGTEVHKATCLPRGHSLGATHGLSTDKVSKTYREAIATLCYGLGGRAAEEVVYGEDGVTSGCSSDLRSSTSYARYMVTECGFSTKLGPIHIDNAVTSPAKRAEVDAEVQRLLNESYDRVKQQFIERRSDLDRLAKTLCEYESLTGEEIKKVLNGEAIRGPLEKPKIEDLVKDVSERKT